MLLHGLCRVQAPFTAPDHPAQKPRGHPLESGWGDGGVPERRRWPTASARCIGRVLAAGEDRSLGGEDGIAHGVGIHGLAEINQQVGFLCHQA